MFTGSCVALVTPMNGDGSVDFPALKGLVQWHLAEKTAAIVICGTTGESATLISSEWAQVVETTVKEVAGKIPVIAGTGTNATEQTIEKTLQAKALGCDGALVVTPYYNRPTQEGLIRHFTAVHDAVNFPIILYNVPSRTGCDLLPETAAILSRLDNMIGIKEATGDLSRVAILNETCDMPFKLYSGDDSSCAAFMIQGGHGVISVVANIVPRALQTMCEFIFSGQTEEALKINEKLQPLYKIMGIESNPIPVKWALKEMGRIQGGIRLPLTPLSSKYQDSVRETLKQGGVAHA